jgi:hypothetical protein
MKYVLQRCLSFLSTDWTWECLWCNKLYTFNLLCWGYVQCMWLLSVVTYSVCDCCLWLRTVYVTAVRGYVQWMWLLSVVTYSVCDCCLRLRTVHVTAACGYVGARDCCLRLRTVHVTAACGYVRCTWLLPAVMYGARDCCLRLRMVHMTAVCSYVWCTWLLSSVTYSVCDCCLWSYWPFEVKALCHFTVPEPNQPQCSVTSQNTVLLCADL